MNASTVQCLANGAPAWCFAAATMPTAAAVVKSTMPEYQVSGVHRGRFLVKAVLPPARAGHWVHLLKVVARGAGILHG